MNSPSISNPTMDPQYTQNTSSYASCIRKIEVHPSVKQQSLPASLSHRATHRVPSVNTTSMCEALHLYLYILSWMSCFCTLHFVWTNCILSWMNYIFCTSCREFDFLYILSWMNLIFCTFCREFAFYHNVSWLVLNESTCTFCREWTNRRVIALNTIQRMVWIIVFCIFCSE